MRRIVSYTLLLACLSGVSFADEGSYHNSDSYKSVEVTDSINSQSKAIKYLTKQLKSMTKKNLELESRVSNLLADINSSSGETSIDPNIIGLIEENKRLSVLVKKDSSKKVEAENRALQNKINNLKVKNKELEVSLKKAIKISNRKNEVYIPRNNKLSRNNDILETQPVSVLMNKLDKLQRENSLLKKDISNKNDNSLSCDAAPISNSKEITLLKNQNKSLVETINAQNASLVSSDNAVKKADKLLTENLILQKQLEDVKKEQLYKGKSAKELYKIAKKFKSEVEKRDKYINKMLLVSSAQKLNETNSALPAVDLPITQEHEVSDNSNQNGNLDALFDKNKRLENQLLTERDATVSYRKKIKEYQDEIRKLNASQSIQ